jgi:hypothetical protein
MPNPGDKGITSREKPKSKIAGNALPNLRFLAKTITSPFPKSQLNQ